MIKEWPNAKSLGVIIKKLHIHDLMVVIFFGTAQQKRIKQEERHCTKS